MIEWLGPVPLSNYLPGRQGHPIAMIVDHWMDASFASALQRFMDPASILSAHYLIGKDGRIVRLVQDEDTSYNAGTWDVNLMCIGIEHEASPTVAPTDLLYEASAQLHRKLSVEHGIDLIVGTTVLPHRAIIPTSCPGTLDLNRIVEEAMATVFVTGDQVKGLIREMIESEEGANLVYDAIAHKYGPLLQAQLDQLRDALLAADNITEVKAVVESLLDVQPFALKPKP